MRPLAFTLLIPILLAPAPALAQDQPATPEDFVCTFSGDCGDEDAQDSPQAAEPAGPRPRLSATRGFALSPPEGARPARRTNPAPRHRRPRNLAATPAASSQAPGQRVNLRLNFESGSAALTPAARAQAEIFAQALLRPQLRNMRFQIEGHTDSVGSRAGNIDLSQRRAQTLADFLASRGVDPTRLTVRGYGPDRPLPGLSGRAGENRRVEAVRIS